MTHNEMDPNRPANDPYVRRPIDDRRGRMGYGIPIALATIAIIFGVMFFMPTNDTTTTASNDAPASRQVNPSTSPAATATTN